MFCPIADKQNEYRGSVKSFSQLVDDRLCQGIVSGLIHVVGVIEVEGDRLVSTLRLNCPIAHQITIAIKGYVCFRASSHHHPFSLNRKKSITQPLLYAAALRPDRCGGRLAPRAGFAARVDPAKHVVALLAAVGTVEIGRVGRAIPAIPGNSGTRYSIWPFKQFGGSARFPWP